MKRTITAILAILVSLANPAYSDPAAADIPAQSAVAASATESQDDAKPYQRRLTTFSDSFDQSKKKVYIVEAYPKIMSDKARDIFIEVGYDVVNEPAGDDVQIISIDGARFNFRRGNANWVDLDYGRLAESSAQDPEGVKKYLEGLQPPPTIGIDAGVFYGATVSLLTGAARGALTNSDARNKSIPFDQAMTLIVNVGKLDASGKLVVTRTIKANVDTSASRFLTAPGELFAEAVGCMITCK